MKRLAITRRFETYVQAEYVNTLGMAYTILVDNEDVHLLDGNLYVDRDHNKNTCYVKKRIDGSNVRLHRLIMGVEDSTLVVDHINRNGLDNRRSNLRIVTSQENRFNSRKTHTLKNTSIYKGVQKRRNKWIARIGINRGRLFLGYFNTEEEAAKAYDKKALELYGDKAYTNFDRSNYE
jgi:hypothetical protein